MTIDGWRFSSRRVAGALLAVWGVLATACAGPKLASEDPAGQRAAEPPAGSGQSRAEERERMVETQLRGRDITHAGVLDTMRRVPRHEFVPLPQRARAYDDTPLPIGEGQTISQPYVVAYMTQAIDPRPTDRVLEIGTGSGYQAAVLAELVREVWTIEIVPALAERARRTFEALGYTNIQTRVGDGYAGWPEEAPFDKIVVTAAPPDIPAALVQQLAVGGVLVAPVGRGTQVMTILSKTPSGVVTRETIPVMFVPMIKKS